MFSPIKLIWRRALFSRVDGALYILWQDQLSSMGFTDTPRDERRISLGRKILVSSFYLFLVLYHLMLSGNFYGSKTRHGIFWGLNYGPCIFFFFFFEAQGVLLGFDFCPIWSSLSLEIRSTPPPHPPGLILLTGVWDIADLLVVCLRFTAVLRLVTTQRTAF